ncbi:MAG TPA: tetratricopeptide repeat protein [Stellaceae bacterium]|nr:tetratricopeptide repeat protein [Stellaceae bacterium]
MYFRLCLIVSLLAFSGGAWADRREDAKALFARAETALDEHKVEAAIADLTTLIKLDPNYLEDFDDFKFSAYDARARAYERIKDHERAIADYTAAIILNPEDLIAYHERAEIHSELGQCAPAIADFDVAIARDPADYKYSYAKRGLCHLALHQFADAASDLAEMRELDPSSAYTVLWLHVARLRAGSDDRKEFIRNSATLDRAKWPGPVVDLFSGKRTAEALRKAATGHADRECQAIFFIAEYDRAEGRAAAAEQEMAEGARICPPGVFQRLSRTEGKGE